MDDITITIDFQLTNGENHLARLLIAKSLDLLIAEALAEHEIDSGDAEIISYAILEE